MIAAAAMLPAPTRVLQTARETADTVTLTFETSGQPFAFSPGQFNMLYVPGIGEAAISMSGAPARAATIAHTIKAVGAVTRALCRSQAGAVFGVRGPFGQPWPLPLMRGQDVLLVAGGLGLAPLRPVIYELLAHRDEYGRIALLVGARTPADLLYRGELADWAARGDVQVRTIVDRAAAGWSGRVGVVPALVDEAAVDPARSVALVCGPEVMMRFTVRALSRLGLAGDRIYLSLERNMKCAVGFCGHCQFGPAFLCKDGPVFRFDRVQPWFWHREI